MFETLPFKKSTVFFFTAGFVATGCGIILLANYHQNKKHGFIK